MLTGDFSDEHFMFYPAQSIMVRASSPNKKTCKNGLAGLAIRGGAIGGYYFRRVFPHRDLFTSDIDFEREGYNIGLKVYSNDTCIESSYGLSYDGAIVFPRNQMTKGVRELFDLIREQSESGILKELTAEELKQAARLVVEDLKTGRHTRKARKEGMEMDVLYGL